MPGAGSSAHDRGMRRIGLALMVMACLGCASAKQVRGPNGPAWVVTCGTDVSLCYDKAAEVCGKPGYSIVDHSQSFAATDKTASTSEHILVECK